MIDFWKRFDIQAKSLALSKKEIAAKTGINYASFVNYSSKGRIPKTEEAVKIARVLGTSVEYLLLGEEVPLERESEDSQENDANTEEPTVRVPFITLRSRQEGNNHLFVRVPRRMVRDSDPSLLRAFSAQGDAMTGIQIYEGDIVIFGRNFQKENGLYVISLYGDWKIKRLEFHSAEQKIYIHSENPKYLVESIAMGNDNLVIRGKVIGWFHAHLH